MAKSSKSKKLVPATSEEQSLNANIETQVEPTVEVTQEIQPVAEEVVLDPITTTETAPEVVIAIEEKIELVAEVTAIEVPVEKIQEPTPMIEVKSIPTRKVGKFVVGEQYLISNPTFFTWLHKQGYSIIERTPLRNGNMNFVVEGGTLDAVSGDIPEYLLFIGNYLSLKRK